MKTWKLEMLLVALVLLGVVIATRGGWLEALGAVAVLAAFGNAQVAWRMAESEATKLKPDVECHKWSGRYLFTKELLWLAYFVAHKSWAALVGVGVFLLYPLWRRWYRKRNPLPLPVDGVPGLFIDQLKPGEKPVPLTVPPSFVRPPKAPPDRLSIDGHMFEVLEGTVLIPGKRWVLRAKLRLGAGDQKKLDEVITNQAVVLAELYRHGSAPVYAKGKAVRGSFFRDQAGLHCGALELKGEEGLQYV